VTWASRPSEEHKEVKFYISNELPPPRTEARAGRPCHENVLKLSADFSAAGAFTGGSEERDSAGEGTGGTFSGKFSGSLRTATLLTQSVCDIPRSPNEIEPSVQFDSDPGVRTFHFGFPEA
jgi:hypothetical protein